MIIRDILNLKGSALFSIAPSGKVTEAVSIMAANDIGSLVVMENGKMTGMFTFREVLKALDARRGNLDELLVANIMTRDPIFGQPGDTLEHLREVMLQHHIRYLPVQEVDKLLGVISFHDVAKALLRETSMENRLLRRYIEDLPEPEAPAQ
ncbi:MAG: CBS domain-containing protein [Pseudomonadota bacterium]